MTIVHSDSIFTVPQGKTPEYNKGNSLLQLITIMSKVGFAASREHYLQTSLQFLIPFKKLQLYNPQGADADILDPKDQDNKTDFQKQNVKSFIVEDVIIVRGYVSVGDWTGPFLKLSYDGSIDSKLSKESNNTLGDKINVWLKLPHTNTQVELLVPYNKSTHRYEIELWSYPLADFSRYLDQKGLEALHTGSLLIQPGIVQGNIDDFAREKLNNVNVNSVATHNLMHPTRALPLELAWSTVDRKHWDSNNGANYRYEFNMILRGWDNYLSAGISPNPHGGLGFLEYRNLLSNYGQFADSNELGRQLEGWNFNSFGEKNGSKRYEKFFTVDYMDLHIMKGNAGIGLHRHRDNQEVFLLMDGEPCRMVVGDWCKMPNRERCFEIRALMPGHMVMLKGGQLHGLMNSSDTDIFLFMFGGYD